MKWTKTAEYEYEYADEMDESMMSSMPMEGDFAAGGEMQALASAELFGRRYFDGRAGQSSVSPTTTCQGECR